MKKTISNKIIDRFSEDGGLVSRIPGLEQDATSVRNTEKNRQPKETQEHQTNTAQAEHIVSAGQSRANVTYSKEQFRQLKLGQKHHLDVTKYWNIHLTAGQMKELRIMLEDGVDIEAKGYNHPSVPAGVLAELRSGQEAGVDMNSFDWRHMSPEQIRQVRLGAEAGLDIKQYAYPIYQAGQMKELRMGMKSGLDIEAYRNPAFSAGQMKELRLQQLFEKVKEQIRQLFQKVKELFKFQGVNQILKKAEQGIDHITNVIEEIGRKELSQGFAGINIPEESMEDRIQETVQDIKELMVAQELAPESILQDPVMSEHMNSRIRKALDALMEPENIQDPAQQDQIVEETVKDLYKEAKVETPVSTQTQTISEAEEKAAAELYLEQQKAKADAVSQSLSR